jgi:GT2 family glycosyltransferase
MVKVSCVLPVYNGLPYLESAVNSVLAQDFTDFELLLINDGSTDGSREICEAIAARDPRVKAITQENAGIVTTLNRGVAMAQGEYIARMDADDLCWPTRFGLQVAYLDAHADVVALGSRVRVMDEHGTYQQVTRPVHWQGGDVFPSSGITLCHPSIMFRREAFERTRGYSEDFHAAEDFALWIEMGQYGKIVEMDACLLDYRVHSQSTSRIKLRQQRLACLRAVLADHARRVAGDAALAARVVVTHELDEVLALCPQRATPLMPSRRAVAAYFQGRMVRGMANRGDAGPAAAALLDLVGQTAALLPQAYATQNRGAFKDAAGNIARGIKALARGQLRGRAANL